MSEELVKSVQDMLNEEKWTRAAISNYTKNQFIELATTIEKAREENCLDAVKDLCEEHLSHTKNSIIALYLSGMIGLRKQTLDNSALITLVNIFIEQQNKTDIVTYLCESILEEDENNKFALHNLAECYKENGTDSEKLLQLYETIVRVDFEEADIAKLLAEKYETSDKTEEAIEYYKRALPRYISKKIFISTQEIWKKLIDLIPEETDFFFTMQRKAVKNFGSDKTSELLLDLYKKYYEREEWSICIEVLKNILSLDEKNSDARKKIVDCYQKKYENHSQLAKYIKDSNLSLGWRNVFDAINDFEKHIAFDVGNFVFHRSWGTGKIMSIKDNQLDSQLVINFGTRHGEKEMSLKMAVDALQPLSKNHIWVLKATKSKEKLAQRIKENKLWALKTIIKSFDNSCDFKQIKAELVPGILSASEWTSWSTAARKLLENEPIFGVNPNDINMYMVRDRKISTEEKLANEFRAQKQFFARVDIIMKFAAEADTESELFAEMFNYFVGYLKSFSYVNEQIMAAYLVVTRIVSKNPHLNPGLTYNFEQLFAEIENPSEMYLSLKDTKNTYLKKDFLTYIKKNLSNWSDVYIKLFPTVLQEEMIKALIEGGHTDKVQNLVLTAFENYRDYRSAAIFFFKECQDEEWYKATNISFEKQMITLIHIMDLGYREIANHYDTTKNRKINTQIEALLFKNDAMLKYLLENDENTIARLYTLVNDVEDLNPEIKITMRNRILEKYPNFKFYGAEEKAITPKGLIVTKKMYEFKKAQLENIINVEIPANAKEIGAAIELGDLRENAEYKAARERQTQLSATVSRLQDEIDRCQIFDPQTVTTSRISFGTTVTLETKDGNIEVYTILGPWESDPDNKIISYMSPLGNAILNGKKGETLSFEINERDYNYTVKNIEIANF